MKYYTTATAAKRLGVSLGTIQSAVKRGILPAKKTDHPVYKTRLVYQISEKALMNYARSESRPGQRTQWTEELDCAILELESSCTAAQIALYLGVTKYQVNHRRAILLQSGRRASTPSNRKNPAPFAMPRTGILIAKSCIRCGLMRDAKYFYKCISKKYNHDYHFTICKLCQNEKKRGTSSNKYSASRKNERLLQEVTLETATRHNQGWTQSEEEKISDMSRSEFDLAIELGRTYSAIRSRRSKLNLYPDRRLHLPNSYWHIDFPAAQRALEDHFKRLGEAVPENLWDWNDEVAA